MFITIAVVYYFSCALLSIGSVKADNANELAGQADVDGFLVGGASLIPNDFIAIVNSAAQKHK